MIITKNTSITSVSGGRTSGYLALNYPVDYYIFSLVRIEDINCKPKDKSLIDYVSNKINMDFIATAESDKTLIVLRQLEQELGKEIIWVTGDTFEKVIQNHANYLPNRQTRFCTSDMKMLPIFWYCYLYLMKHEEDFLDMFIGYRADEPKRKANDFYEFVRSCNNFGKNRQNWQEMEWRDSSFPLREDGITNFDVKKFWRDKPEYEFPIESNCVGCFHKPDIILKEQFIYEPEKMRWFMNMEKLINGTFKKGITYEQIMNTEYNSIQEPEPWEFNCNCTD